MLDQEKLKNKTIYQERLNHLAVLALDVVEGLLTDTETPIDTRLNAAFRIFELSDTQVPKQLDNESTLDIIKGIEKNADKLALLQTLLISKDKNNNPLCNTTTFCPTLEGCSSIN